MSQIYRLHYRAQLQQEYAAEHLQEAIEKCKENIRNLQTAGKILTAALYYADKMLFLYYEAVGTSLDVVEPIALQPDIENLWKYEELQGQCVESGEDVQADVPHPNDFLAVITPYLLPWPGQHGARHWVHMYHFYYHSKPEGVQQWKRVGIPDLRRGRIAFLRDDKLINYIYHHQAIVEEGLLSGDRYQSIALHENILFSYFEEPKTMANIKNRPAEKSKVIADWIGADPEAHFIHMPEGNGENFMFLPVLFAMGVEDLE